MVDPTTTGYRVKHAINSCAAVVGSALVAAVPPIGLGLHSMGQAFNDSKADRPLQNLTKMAHLASSSLLSRKP